MAQKRKGNTMSPRLECTRTMITTHPWRLVVLVLFGILIAFPTTTVIIGSHAFGTVVVQQLISNNNHHSFRHTGIEIPTSSSSSFLSLPRASYKQKRSVFVVTATAINAGDTNTTSSVKGGIGNDNDTVTGTANDINTLSRKEQRQRYDTELEEAFAQQMKKKNPLLGIKSIGVDYGLVRTGIAVTIGYTPQALEVIVTDHPLVLPQVQQKYNNETLATRTRPKPSTSMSFWDKNEKWDKDEKTEEEEEEERLEKQRSEVATRVVELARREKVDRIVVGLPLHKNGTEADQTKLTRKFAYDHLAKLSLRILGPDVPIFLWDERYTSKEAAARIRSRASDNGGNSGDLYGCLDAESAIIILEHYYEENHQQYNTQYLNVDDGNNNDNDNDNDNDNTINDQYFNGEIVTISDVDLVNKLTLEYEETRRQERQQIVEEGLNRESRTKWRKLAMEEDRIREEEERKEAMANSADDDDNSSNGTKKKKKKKRKRK